MQVNLYVLVPFMCGAIAFIAWLVYLNLKDESKFKDMLYVRHDSHIKGRVMDKA